MAGIINIVLKQEADLGVSGGYTLSAMSRDRWNGAGNVGYGRGGLSLASSVGYLADDRRFVGAIDRERYDVARALTGMTLQDVGGTTANRGVNVTANADWKVGPRDVLSEALVVNLRTGGEDSRIAWTDLGAAGAPINRFLRPRATTTRGVLVDATTAWKRTLAPRRHELAAELRANRTDDADRTLFTRRSFDGATLLDGERNDADAAATQLTAQLDYTRPVGKAVRFETGYRGNSRWLDRDLRAALDPAGNGRWTPSPLSNAFRFGEHVQAGYAVVTRTARGVDVQGGLRTEYTARTFAIGGARNPFRYVSVFPSASLSYGASGPTQARLSFARRIRRPGEGELNPFPRFLDVQNAFVGNPALRPEYTDALEASLARTGRLGTVQVAPFVRRTTDIIRVDVDPDAVVQGRNVTTVSFVNLATSRSFGADLSGTLKAGTRFTGLGAFNVYRLVTSGGSATSLGVDAVAWSARLNGTLRLTDGLSAQATYFYRAPYGIERNRWDAFQTTTLLLRQKVRGERGAVTLRALDPFNTNRWAIRGGTASLVQFTERTPGVRGVFVGYQYTVGQAPRLRQPRQDPQAAAPAGGFAPP
jgi:outer membrane receptor protein involved in Fe transport